MIDLNSEAVRADPYAAYEVIRRAGPVVHDPKTGACYVARYADVQEALKNPQYFSNREAGPEPTLQGADGQAHRAARKMIQPAFSPERIASLQPELSRLADEVILALAGRDSCEFMSEVAAVLPASVLGWMMGDGELTPQLARDRTDGIIATGAARMRVRRGGPGTGLPAGEAAVASSESLAESEAYLRQALDRAAQQETGGWVADMLAAEYRAGRLSAEEFIDMGLLMIVGATETTTSLTGTCVHWLARDPGLQERLRREPERIEPFIEEMLRYDAPVQRRPRVALQGAVLSGVALAEGTLVTLLIGAANRDPERFEHADRFDPDREGNRHLSFGGGPHICPGAQLGRLEARAVVQSLLRHLPPFRLADPSQPIEHPRNLSLRGPRRLGIAFLGAAT